MPNAPSEIFPVIFIFLGTVLSFLSAFGLNRFPDVYSRAHAASKTQSLGVLITLTGTFIFFLLEMQHFNIRLFLGIAFVFITAPVSAHVICRSAYRGKVKLADTSAKDDLKEVLERELRVEK